MTVPDPELWSIPGSDGAAILGVTDASAVSAPAVAGDLVLVHGFKGYYDYGLFPVLTRAAVAAGLTVHRFNFSHSGMTRATNTFARPDLFEQDTWARQQHDLAAVLDHVDADARPPVVFGHSRGGLTSLVATPRHAGRIAGVISAAAPADACTLDDTQRRLLKKHGRLPSPSGRTGQELFVGRAWLDDIEADPTASDPVIALRNSPDAPPVLLLHGDADTTVPPSALTRLHAAHPAAEAVVLPGANHVFNIVNPHPIDAPLDPVAADFVKQVVDFAVRCVADVGR